MPDLTYQTLDGTFASLPSDAVAAFSQGIRGGVLTPADADYDRARSIWNAMIDRRPAMIARCLGTQDVRNAVAFARTRRMLVSVRGGGHHIAGNALVEGGLTIDLSGMRTVRVDENHRAARAGAGALLGDVDHETQAFGLATPLGINSTTGLAGLCLGGGFGWLTRLHGLTIDNLISADVVTADGRLQVVSSEQEPDLFWGIRGGGGNFGVVTSFELRLHPVGPLVHAGLVVYPFTQAQRVLRAWRDFIANAPMELSIWPVLRQAPPLPFLPESIHGREVVVFAVMHGGELHKGERIASAVLGFGEPVGSMLVAQPYTAFQAAFDPLLAPGARNYWKSHNFREITDDLIDALIDSATKLPGPECEIFVAQLGGAAGQVPVADTAYAGRDANFVMNVHGRWRKAADDGRIRDWARGVFQDTARFATGGGYVNFLTEDEAQRVESAYGGNHARLREIKQRFDPENLFRMNQNIAPAALSRAA